MMTRKMIARTLALTVLLMLFTVPAVAGDSKIAYINLQQALNSSEAGINAKEELQKEAAGKEKELEAKQEEMKKLNDEMEKKAALWNDETKIEKEAEFKKKGMALQRQFEEYGKELGKKKQQVEAKIIDGLSEAVKAVAKKEGYDYVFERSVGGLIVVDESADLTEKVIKHYNETYRKSKK